MLIWEFRWAEKEGRSGMISIEEALYFGYEKFRQHPFYPTSWLMRRIYEGR